MKYLLEETTWKEFGERDDNKGWCDAEGRSEVVIEFLLLPRVTLKVARRRRSIPIGEPVKLRGGPV